jgi:hypothetical protein
MRGFSPPRKPVRRAPTRTVYRPNRDGRNSGVETLHIAFEPTVADAGAGAYRETGIAWAADPAATANRERPTRRR